MKNHNERILEFIETIKGKKVVQLKGSVADLLKMKFDLDEEPTYSITDDPIPRLVAELGEKRLETGVYFLKERRMHHGKISEFLDKVKSPLGKMAVKEFILTAPMTKNSPEACLRPFSGRITSTPYS